MDDNVVLSVFARPFLHNSTLCFPESLNVPEGALLNSVHYDFQTRQFLFDVSHDSFDLVEDGCVAPMFPSVMGARTIAVRILK